MRVLLSILIAGWIHYHFGTYSVLVEAHERTEQVVELIAQAASR